MKPSRIKPWKTDREKLFYIKQCSTIFSRVYWMLSTEFKAVTYFRVEAAVRRVSKKNLIARVLLKNFLFIPLYLHFRHFRIKHKIFIDKNAVIGPGFYIVHASQIFIGPVTIGANCIIHHNVTMGQGVAKREKSVPRIGDNVWIGTGVILSGNIEIGSNTVISSGSVLSKSVPGNCLVAGNPARVILANYDSSEYCTFKPEEKA